MTDFESPESSPDATLTTLENLPAEVLARIPAACIDCSTARLRAFRGNLDRECHGPTDSIEIAGQILTGQFCRYPTGATPEAQELNKIA